MTTGQAQIEPVRFATEDVPARHRLAVWREVLGRVHLHLDVEPVGDAPLCATVEAHRWAPASLYFSDTTPVRASRTPEFVQDGDGDFRLLRADGAGYRFTAHGVDEVVGAGNGALLFNGTVGAVTYLGPCHVTAVRVSRSDLASALRGFDDRPFRAAAPDSAAFRLLTDYVAFLRRQGPSSDMIVAGRVASHLTDLVALALGATGDAAEVARGRGMRVARLVAIKADIDRNLADARLSADSLAIRHGVTPRYVRKLFETEGLSLSEFVLTRRLMRAHHMLSDARLLGRTISSIAFDVGFADLSYFNRSFRRRYGATPSDVRDAALGMRDG